LGGAARGGRPVAWPLGVPGPFPLAYLPSDSWRPWNGMTVRVWSSGPPTPRRRRAWPWCIRSARQHHRSAEAVVVSEGPVPW